MKMFNEKVRAAITRIPDDNGSFYLVRNETKICFGKGETLLGSAVMTNPGSFDFDKDPIWEGFLRGKGNDTLTGDGYPDYVMTNIIRVVRKAYEMNNMVPNGYVNIYNISSARCPKSEKAEDCHRKTKNLIISKNLDISLLEDAVSNNKENFLNMCNNSTFVIIGFCKNVFTHKVYNILNWIDEAKCDNIVQIPDKNLWPYHPRVWITMKIIDTAIENLYNILRMKK